MYLRQIQPTATSVRRLLGGCDESLPSHITLLQIQPLYAYAYRFQMTRIVEHPVSSGYKIRNINLLQNLI